MLSLIENTCVEKKQKISHDAMMNTAVIAESAPGPIMVNMATYAGNSQAGIPGALIAATTVVPPLFVIFFLITALLKKH